jgi:hypothetical protein
MIQFRQYYILWLHINSLYITEVLRRESWRGGGTRGKEEKKKGDSSSTVSFIYKLILHLSTEPVHVIPARETVTSWEV